MSKHESVIKDIKKNISHYDLCIKDTVEYIAEKENDIVGLKREIDRYQININELKETLSILENDS